MQERKPLVAMTATQKSKAAAKQERKPLVVLMTDPETMVASQTETMMAPTVATVVAKGMLASRGCKGYARRIPIRRKQGMQSLQ